MKFTVAIVFILSPVVSGQGANYGPLTQLFNVLNDMVQDSKTLMHEEQVAWAGFKEFCEGTQERYNGIIDRLTARKGKTDANLALLESEKTSLSAMIADHEQKHRTMEGNKNVMTRLLEIEKRRYQQNKEALTQLGVDLANAIADLKAQHIDVMSTGAGAPADALEPESFVYQGALGPVIDAFENAQTENTADKAVLEQENEDRNALINNKHDEFARLMQFTTDAKGETETRLNQVEDAMVKAHSSSAEDDRDINAERNLLTELETSCASKAGHFAHQQKFRRDEAEALETVIEILSSPDVMKPHDKHYQDMVKQIMEKQSTSLAQLRGEGEEDIRDIRKQASQYLMDASVKFKSTPLSTLATRIVADPFTKIRSMVEEMIFALEERQRQEITKKGWCDTEMKTNTFTRNKKVIVIEDLHYAIEKLNRNIADATEKVKEKTTEIGQKLEDEEKGKDLREIRAQEFKHEVRDLEIALNAIGKAREILEQTYSLNRLSQASETQNLMPSFSITAAQEWDDSAGSDTDINGVMGTIYGGDAAGLQAVRQVNTVEVMFRTHVAQTKTNENAEIDQFAKLQMATEKDIRVNKMEIEKHERDLASWETKLNTANGDLEVETKNLIEQNNYHDELFKKCIQQGLPIDAAVELSVNELVSLREALRILNGEGVGAGVRGTR